jgi:glutathione S-transferase
MTESYRLYHSETCGFCHRVRRYFAQAGWDIPLADTLRDANARSELIREGGRGTVPCLRIDRAGERVWLYESLDIIAYLEARRGAGAE